MSNGITNYESQETGEKNENEELVLSYLKARFPSTFIKLISFNEEPNGLISFVMQDTGGIIVGSIPQGYEDLNKAGVKTKNPKDNCKYVAFPVQDATEKVKNQLDVIDQMMQDASDYLNTLGIENYFINSVTNTSEGLKITYSFGGKILNVVKEKIKY